MHEGRRRESYAHARNVIPFMQCGRQMPRSPMESGGDKSRKEVLRLPLSNRVPTPKAKWGNFNFPPIPGPVTRLLDANGNLVIMRSLPSSWVMTPHNLCRRASSMSKKEEVEEWMAFTRISSSVSTFSQKPIGDDDLRRFCNNSWRHCCRRGLLKSFLTDIFQPWTKIALYWR